MKFKSGEYVYHRNTKKVYQTLSSGTDWGYVDVKPPKGRNTYVDGSHLTKATEQQIEELWFQKTEEGKKVMEETLYEVTTNGVVTFCKKLTVNSEGKWVMETKGTGNVFLADSADCKEVVQYTIRVKFLVGGNTGEFVSKAGTFAEGDVFVTKGGDFAIVVALDTKNRRATKKFIPTRRIVMEDL